jgi:hypothetical protein
LKQPDMHSTSNTWTFSWILGYGCGYFWDLGFVQESFSWRDKVTKFSRQAGSAGISSLQIPHFSWLKPIFFPIKHDQTMMVRTWGSTSFHKWHHALGIIK